MEEKIRPVQTDAPVSPAAQKHPATPEHSATPKSPTPPPTPASPSKTCFCCGTPIPADGMLCPKCGAFQPEPIDLVAHRKWKKVRKAEAGIGLTVGFFAMILFATIGGADSYLFLLGPVTGIVSALLFEYGAAAWGKRKQAAREERWRAQEERDLQYLALDTPASRICATVVAQIRAVWEEDADTRTPRPVDALARAKRYVLTMRPETFLRCYATFRCGDRDEIRDALYLHFPAPALDALTEMGLFVFRTKQQIPVLQWIAGGEQEAFAGYQETALTLLRQELPENP